MMNYRPYDAEKDGKAAHRIWREVGWIDSEIEEKAMDFFLAGSDVLVTDIDGEAEVLVASMPATVNYLDEKLPVGIIAAVTTSRVARKQGLAGRLTARMIASQVAQGAAVSMLGMFEQGFYNRLGFGTGCYEHWVRFDPAALVVSSRARPPRRLTTDNAEAIHNALLGRHRAHGVVDIAPVEFSRAELQWTSNGFGLGYYDGDDGALSHFIWCAPKGENGPYRIGAMAYRNRDEFLELMALLKGLGDQVRTVRMREPAHIQLQDMVSQPFQREIVSEKTKHATGNYAIAYWQLRICDLAACMAATKLPGETVRFNLALTDPIEAYLDDDIEWRGIGGDYIVTLGPESAAEAGADLSLPTLTASVNAFSRLWFGVRPAIGLAITDELDGPDGLLRALDQILRLPAPHPDWDF